MTGRGTFWDKRRAAVAAEAQAEAEALERYQISQAHEELSDEEILETLNLPQPETLGPGDDFSVFLAKTVPHHLKNRALRVLWRSNPVLANVDGLNEYDDDYFSASYGNGPIATAYKIGKGMLRHLEDLESKSSAQDPDQEKESTPVESEEQVSETFQTESDVHDEIQSAPMQTAEGTDVVHRPRRMRFDFEEATA